MTRSSLSTVGKSALALTALAVLLPLSRPAYAGPPNNVEVFVGYADQIRTNPFFPNPWDGSPNTIFLGSGNDYDSGAVRLENIGTTDFTLDPGAHVDGFATGNTVQLWDTLIGTGLTVHPGEQVIFTQTADNNFDSSEFVTGNASNPDHAQPVIHLTLDNTAVTFTDTAQVLNTGGFDRAYNGTNESLQWRPIGTTGIGDPGGNPGGVPGVPEPSSVTAFTLGVLGLAGLLLRARQRRSLPSA